MKKTIVSKCGLQVIGEIDENLLENYVVNTIPVGVEVIIGDNIEDVIRQISINLRQQGCRDILINDISKKSKVSLEIEKSLIPIIKKFYGVSPCKLRKADKIRLKILELCDLIDYKGEK